MNRSPEEVKIPCPCCGKPIYIDLKIFSRYRQALKIIGLADRFTANFLYPHKYKDPMLRQALQEFDEQLGHIGPADTRRRTWKMYVIDLILSSANIRACLKYFKLRLKSGE